MNMQTGKWRIAGVLVLGALSLTGCRTVEVTPAAPPMPRPLVVPFTSTVGVYYSEDFMKFAHREERWGAKWAIHLGDGHKTLLDLLLKQSFDKVVQVPDLKSGAKGEKLIAILEPGFDQYSFITPEDTAGGYFAATIKYRINVYTPGGELVDTLIFTGYGSAYGSRAAPSLAKATQAAMRDASARFLVQFPEQAIARKLRAGEPLVVAQNAAPANTGIEAVSIIDGGTPPSAETPAPAQIPPVNKPAESTPPATGTPPIVPPDGTPAAPPAQQTKPSP